MSVCQLSDIVFTYLKMRKYENKLGYSFNFYKKNIEYVCKISDKKFVRSVFNKLLKDDKIRLIKYRKSSYYLFNPKTQKRFSNNKYDFTIEKKNIFLKFE